MLPDGTTAEHEVPSTRDPVRALSPGMYDFPESFDASQSWGSTNSGINGSQRSGIFSSGRGELILPMAPPQRFSFSAFPLGTPQISTTNSAQPAQIPASPPKYSRIRPTSPKFPKALPA